MPKTKLLLTIIALIVAVLAVIGVVKYRQSHSGLTSTVDNDPEIDLPINVIPLEERPFITLTPDKTGHSLDISVSGAPKTGKMEYEMIYNASGKQEGALGTISLASETQPIVKQILLGSRSAGGATTYHEGVTGGSITVTYGDTRLKESWNYLHFDPTDPSFSSVDGKLSVTLPKTALKKDDVIVTMKTFGYNKAGLPAEHTKLVAGPYGYFAQATPKGNAQISLKLPAGEHVNPTIYEWNETTWKKLPTKLSGDTVTSTGTGSVFLVTAE